MKRVLLLMAAVLAVVAFGLMIGCSDDDDEDTNPIITGDPNSPTYEFFDDMASETSTMPAEFSLGSVFAFIDYIRNIPRKDAADDPTLSDYSYENGWHIVHFTMSFEDTIDIQTIETITVSGWDSLQQWLGGNVVQYVEQQPDSLVIKSHFDAGMTSTGPDYASAQAHQYYTLSKIDGIEAGDDWRIDGVGFDTLTIYFEDDSSNTCNLNAKVSTVYNGLEINENIMTNDGCPTAGSMSSGMTLALTVGGDNSNLESLIINGLWTVTEAFNGSTITRTVSFGNTVWTETYSCD